MGGGLAAAAIGAGWAAGYGLPGSAIAASAGLHGVAGLALGALLGRLHPALAAVAAAVLFAALPAGWAALTAAPEASAPLAPRPVAKAEPRDATARRVAVIGLDGADWRVIDPLLAAGELPHLRALLARGRGWVLRSTDPSSSPVVWTSIFSGKPPEAHGITDWDSSRADNRRAALLWELLAGAGLRSVVVNVPGSWPPTAVDGAFVSGFPMPSPLLPASAETGFQNLGTLVDPEARAATLTVVGARDGRADVSLGRLAPRARGSLRHPLFETRAARRWLPARSLETEVALANGSAPPPGEWSHWHHHAEAGVALVYRMHRLADSRLWLTPAFQDPARPSLVFTNAPWVAEALAANGPYVVEGAGWRLAAEPALRTTLVEHLEQVEARHRRAAETLLAAVPDWRLFAHVITLPDRVSHAFWRFHAPSDYPAAEPGEAAAQAERVREAYRVADVHLGALLARVDDGETLIVVPSDHGFQSNPPEWGNHRDAGILVLAGPGVGHRPERGERSIYDVTPLALAALGLPVASDMVGEVPGGLAAADTVRRIASYERGAAPAAGARIDETTTEQLRSLGYVE